MNAAAGPDVSLVIAVYQRDDFLTLVLTSLLDQTLRNFEVIVADDGSGPAIAAIIDQFQGTLAHPILHVRHDDDGFRKTVIVNRAVTRARADFLTFIDGDCILHRRFLERHHRRRRRGLALSGRRVMFDRALTERLTPDDVRSRRIQSSLSGGGTPGASIVGTASIFPFCIAPGISAARTTNSSDRTSPSTVMTSFA